MTLGDAMYAHLSSVLSVATRTSCARIFSSSATSWERPGPGVTTALSATGVYTAGRAVAEAVIPERCRHRRHVVEVDARLGGGLAQHGVQLSRELVDELVLVLAER